ncbi:hypothetical protein KG112_13985 [Nocardioides sp. zg-ZUI104]|uniref:ferredoxin--NADP reductase n=1 Tax=Nocardioides faecalis TaxID=2803858 RepID=UPI001BCCBB60|nr:hypothetical protein [Nocardioides faecalis]MBS4753918.1 hypothetical protein [Nocardioides faecalis]
MIARLDAALLRLSIYRVVSIVLTALAVVAVVLTATGTLGDGVFGPDAMLVSAVVLVGGTVAVSTVLARLFGTRAQWESGVITGLLLWFLYWPTTDAAELGWLAGAAVLAAASKFLLARHGRHVFNPAAAGVVLLALIAWALGQPASAPYTTWWVASEPLVGWVLVGALVVLWRLRRWAHSVVFVVLGGALTVLTQLDAGLSGGEALRFALISTPLVFFAGFMLTEPLTLAPRRRQQVLAAVVAAVVFTLPLTVAATGYVLHLTPVGGPYEIALLAANLVAFLSGQRGSRLTLVQRRELGDDTVELAFRPARGLRFTPGQYLELDLAPSGALTDSRGLRRMLSISSPPGELVTVAVRVPARPSRFKQVLQALEPGAVVRACAVGGDFVLPHSTDPVALVAGGIGVTPYLSQLRTPGALEDRDVVLVYGTRVGAVAELPYGAELIDLGVPVVVVSPQRPTDLPAHWRHVASELLDAAALHAAVPDLDARRVHLSGPPAMVDALRARLSRARTDHFAGY